MKRKLAAIVLSAVMVMGTLTGCGGSSEPAEAAVEETAEETTEDAAEDTAEAADGMVTDETWATLQDNYAAMVDAYNAVVELYNSDEVAADADIEDVLTQAEDVINQMGDIDQTQVAEADAETLNGAMMDILDALSLLVDGMDAAEGTTGSDEVVSDETWATLQENYSAMTDAYNAVVELYNSDDVAADADVEDALKEAEAIITEMGDIDQTQVTEADAETLNGAMENILDGLNTVVDNMQAAE